MSDRLVRSGASFSVLAMVCGLFACGSSPDEEYANRMAAENTSHYDIVGQTCNAEILTHQLPAPTLEPGDLVAFLNTGAYGEPNAANFNALPRPGMVVVNGEQAALVRRAETVDDVFARDEIPGWLSG